MTPLTRETLPLGLFDRLLSLLKGIRRDAKDPAVGGEIEVRLQVLGPDDWFLRTGDAGYDPSHHGYWGSGMVSAGDLDTDLAYLADQLIEEVLDDSWNDPATHAETA